MNKRVVIFIISASVLLIGAVGASGNNQSPKINNIQGNSTASASDDDSKKIAPACDGTSITAACKVDEINYKTYIYHPAVAEKTHVETTTTYREEVTGYCTLCNDGTYSPTCATGRGTCSHHDGVAEWNAPIVKNVPVYLNKTVVDAPAVDEYYEKVLE